MKVGLIAHDSKKKLMQNFCIAYRGILTRHELYATGTTGSLIQEVSNLRIHKFLPGETGGVRQLASQIEQGNLDMIIFLRNPNPSMEEETEVNFVLRLCDMYNIPIGTNLATAELLIHALERGELEWRNIG
ncbi:methylglyoxal synthase [Oribacterium parvum ACB1]|jgi:methylglyoxal synthase|uniref:Methylglyoxal synthase n=1 Tax=Oribacterium parvum ACB1 TaxID=796943 RepID=G9WM26_9FIRM|nr:methylglyoxal synthase [Oribacterium parvum]EHL12372.1 methylglyoxal synthase [Oribacterium parvum ACB1]EJF12721.1 putative methylglyoxal synthase [Oribacterium parvum ACB8]MBF1267998.1 methylglyoxal synthase [Oribacterium parvum]